MFTLGCLRLTLSCAVTEFIAYMQHIRTTLGLLTHTYISLHVYLTPQSDCLLPGASNQHIVHVCSWPIVCARHTEIMSTINFHNVCDRQHAPNNTCSTNISCIVLVCTQLWTKHYLLIHAKMYTSFSTIVIETLATCSCSSAKVHDVTGNR